MKVEISETLNFPPEIIFGILTDIPHHVDWAAGLIELIRLTDNPAKQGSIWEHISDLLGRRLVTSNECDVHRVNQTFGWITRKPITCQITLSLEPE